MYIVNNFYKPSMIFPGYVSSDECPNNRTYNALPRKSIVLLGILCEFLEVRPVFPGKDQIWQLQTQKSCFVERLGHNQTAGDIPGKMISPWIDSGFKKKFLNKKRSICIHR